MGKAIKHKPIPMISIAGSVFFVAVNIFAETKLIIEIHENQGRKYQSQIMDIENCKLKIGTEANQNQMFLRCVCLLINAGWASSIGLSYISYF